MLSVRWIMVFVAVAAAVLLIPAFSFNLLPDWQKSYPNLDIIFLAGFILIEVILFLLGTLIEDKRRVQDKRERHSKDMYEVYKRLLHVWIRTYYKDKSLQFKVTENYEATLAPGYLNIFEAHESEPTLILVSEIENFNWAMEHLKHKKYDKIRNAWEEANKHRESCSNSKAEELATSMFEYRVRDGLKGVFPKFIDEAEVDITIGKDAYHSKRIARLLVDNYFFIQRENGIFKVFKESYTYVPGHFRIMLFGEPIMTSPNEASLPVETIQQILSNIFADVSIKGVMTDYLNEYQAIVKSLETFNKELEPLVQLLKGGGLVEGKCDIGY